MDEESTDGPIRLRGEVYHCLFRLDLGEGLSDGDDVTRGDHPGLQSGLRGAGEDFGHANDLRHDQAPNPTRTASSPATTSSVRAIAARSSTREMLGEASPPVTRATGWSSQSKYRRWISSAS